MGSGAPVADVAQVARYLSADVRTRRLIPADAFQTEGGLSRRSPELP